MSDGHLIVTATTDGVSFDYLINDDASFTQISWTDHGEFKPIHDDPPWVKVESVDD